MSGNANERRCAPEPAPSNGEARDPLEQLAAEQTALRRVATLVARESSPAEIFGAVTDEAHRVLATEAVGLLRFEPDGTAVLVAQSETPWDPPPLGTRFTLEGENVIARLFRSGEAGRVDDWADATGSVAAMASVLGVRSAVATPIVVEGRLWGTLIAATSKSEPLPQDTESRIEQFCGLVATAIVNAEARNKLSLLAEEQAALRRVATLVARDAPSEQVFDAVAREVGELLDANLTVLGRYDGDGAATAIGSWSSSPRTIPVGTRSKLGGRNVLTTVHETAAPARLDSYEDATGEAGAIAKQFGWRSSIATPITVEGRVWGVMLVATMRGEPFPDGAEDRLAAFTELVATTIANAQAQGDLGLLLDEQAALRRVATLVARGVGPEGVFRAVAAEVGVLFGSDVSAIVRFEDDGTATVLGDIGGPHQSGKRVSLDPGYVVHAVRETSRSARFDTDDPSAADGLSLVRSLGIRSAVASPIVVEGELWGAITAAALHGPLASGAERRLTDFTELIATAVANTQAREQVTALAEEQAALRRVATLVAEGAARQAVFEGVCAEAGALLGAAAVNLSEYTRDGFDVSVAGWSLHGTRVEDGARYPLTQDTVGGRIVETGAPVRVDSWESGESELTAIARSLGVRSCLGAPVVVEGHIWGGLVAGTDSEKPFPPGTELRLARFAELTATAVANATARAELIASRARIVAAGDEARRRIERDLHDGTQQRLIALGLDLQRARAGIPEDRRDTRAALERMGHDLEAILEDLRELSHGLHPPLLSRGGLGASLQALARRSPIPVALSVELLERPPASSETAVYYVVSEALTNAIKHSQASEISVTITSDSAGRVRATIVDDGIGGADPSRGSGLTGLLDRIDALGGRFALDSPPRDGTRMAIELPVETPAIRSSSVPS